jgi:hypothetical protein
MHMRGTSSWNRTFLINWIIHWFLLHRDASFPISFPSCRNLGRELRRRLVKEVALLFHALNVRVFGVQLLQAPE